MAMSASVAAVLQVDVYDALAAAAAERVEKLRVVFY